MDHQALQRPRGFTPSEISRLTNLDVVWQHADEAAFLWTLRNRAVNEPHYSLKDLAALDERVEAHVDGLRASSETGWKHCKSNLENLGPGEIFAAAALAFSTGDRTRMREALEVGCSSPATVQGLVSALGWLDLEMAWPWIDLLQQARSAVHRAIGIRASAVHRTDPGPVLAAAVVDSDQALRVSAIRSVGELKHSELIESVSAQQDRDDESTRFWAAWSLTLIGDAGGLAKLQQWFKRQDTFGVRSIQLGLRAMDLDASRQWLNQCVKTTELLRQAITGAGIIGDPAAIPWLIRMMRIPDVARIAGEAFTMITGIDLGYHDLDQDPPEADADTSSIEELLDLTYDSNLRWPSPARVEAWWESRKQSYPSGTRYLVGKPITIESAREVLITGTQRQRAGAALELALRQPEQILFEVRARGARQHQALASWNS